MSLQQTLADLVSFPTVSSEPVTALADYLANRCESAGMRVERLFSEPGKCNLICSAGPVGTDGVILSGHMDVVPVKGQPWDSDPFILTARGDNLHGRGSCDMKAFLAAIVYALPNLPIRRLDRELMLVFTYDEEVGCHGSRALVEQFSAENRPTPKACLIGEPTSMSIFRMHPGHAAVRIICTGQAAHSSKPDLGKSAILVAGRVISALDSLAADWAKRIQFADMLERPFVVMNIATISGGAAINIVPDRCVIDVGFRPLPGMNPDDLVDELRDRALNAGASEVGLLRVTPAMLTPEKSPLEAILRTFATSQHIGAAAFATDGGNLQQLGVQTLVFGPGSIDVAHQANEYVPIAELHRAVDVVEAVVAARCLT